MDNQWLLGFLLISHDDWLGVQRQVPLACALQSIVSAVLQKRGPCRIDASDPSGCGKSYRSFLLRWVIPKSGAMQVLQFPNCISFEYEAKIDLLGKRLEI